MSPNGSPLTNERDAQSLFGAAARAELERRAPLATRLRPSSLDEVIGQSHLLAKGAPLRSLIDADRVSSAIFFGPPGTGKTTVARLVASTSKKAFVQLSAVAAGVKEVREVFAEATQRLGTDGRATVLFLDEIHRFTRSQQDALLPAIEEGTITLVGATTENPFISLNAPLISRSTLYRFEPLSAEELAAIVRRAVEVEGVEITDEAITACVAQSDGDARSVIGTLEVAIALLTTGDDPDAAIDRSLIEQARHVRPLRHGQDEHYDLLSVFIKSMRGSDPDAAIYWMSRLLVAGEDPRVVARRLLIFASEDIGLADSRALSVAEGAYYATEHVGMPEVTHNLSHAVIYLTMAPKSNRVKEAFALAQDDLANQPLYRVPARFRDTSYRGAARLGHGAGYEYPHSDPRGSTDNYLPNELAGRRYYEPSDHGDEASLVEAVEQRRQAVARRLSENQVDEVER